VLLQLNKARDGCFFGQLPAAARAKYRINISVISAGTKNVSEPLPEPGFSPNCNGIYYRRDVIMYTQIQKFVLMSDITEYGEE
jgi:hypothetical protein